MAKAIPLHRRTAQRCSTRHLFRMGPMASGTNDGTREADATGSGAHRASGMEETVAEFCERKKTSRRWIRWPLIAATAVNFLRCKSIFHLRSARQMCMDAAQLCL